MAADPSLVQDNSSSRMLTGVGIALLILATIGAAALLAPRLKEEFREDIFAAPRTEAPVRASQPSPNMQPVAAPAPVQSVPTPAPAAVPATPTPIPQGSLTKGEVEVPAAPLPLKKATKLKTRPHPHPARRTPQAPTQRAEYVGQEPP